MMSKQTCSCVTRYLAPALFLAACFPGHAQQGKSLDTTEPLHIAPAPSERFPAKWYPPVGSANELALAPVIGHPYTATLGHIAPVQKGPGESQSTTVSGFQARDRFGRTRSEAVTGGMALGDQAVQTKSVEVSDPVSHCSFRWTEAVNGTALPTAMRSALVRCAPQSLRYKQADVWGSILSEDKDGTVVHGTLATTKTEHLPDVTLDGVTIRRLRVTNTYPAQRGQSNKRITESWYSPELQELVRLGNEEEGFDGFIHINREEPDPKLFYPPEGFDIQVDPVPWKPALH